MYLILGHAHDPCCSLVQSALEARGFQALVVENALAHPARVSWRLDSEGSVSQFAWDDEEPVAGDEIEGVLVRDVGWVDPVGWHQGDLAYVQAETQAALLGWLWSLPGPVLNRYPAATWYRPEVPLLMWRSLLWRCGLPVPETLLTNVNEEARAFGQGVTTEGMTGAVYRPLTSGSRYLVASDRDWSGLAAMQVRAPVCLTYRHALPRSVCIVGQRVVWDGTPPPGADALEPPLRAFASAAGLAFVEVVLAETTRGLAVVSVEHHPQLEHFEPPARQAIVGGLVHVLTAASRTVATESVGA